MNKVLSQQVETPIMLQTQKLHQNHPLKIHMNHQSKHQIYLLQIQTQSRILNKLI